MWYNPLRFVCADDMNVASMNGVNSNSFFIVCILTLYTFSISQEGVKIQCQQGFVRIPLTWGGLRLQAVCPGFEAFGVGAPFLDDLGHIGGEVGVELDPLISGGVGEPEFFGVEGLAGKDGEAVIHELLVFAKDGAFNNAVSAVGGIAEEGVAGVLHVDADLVGAPGLEAELGEGDVVEPFQHFVMGDGIFAVVAIGEGIHYFAEAQVAANVGLYGAFVFLEVAPNEGDVAAIDGVFFELGGQLCHGGFGLCDDHKAACVFIYTVNEAYAGEAIDHYVLLLQVPTDAIDEGAAVVAAAGVDDHAEGLIDDHEVIVLIDDVEGHLLGDDLLAFGAAGLVYDNGIIGADLVVGSDYLAVDGDVAAFEVVLDLVAGGAFEAVHEELIDAEGLLALIGNDAHALYGLTGGLGSLFFRFFVVPNIFYVLRCTHCLKSRPKSLEGLSLFFC